MIHSMHPLALLYQNILSSQRVYSICKEPAKLKAALTMLENIDEDQISQSAIVEIRVEKAALLAILGNGEEIFDLLSPFVKNHFGRLVDIAWRLLAWGPNYTQIFTLHAMAVPYLLNGHFDESRFPPIQYYATILETLLAEDADESIPSSIFQKILDEMKQFITDDLPPVRERDWNYARGIVSMKTKKYEEALNYFAKYQKSSQGKFGMRFSLTVIFLKAKCYAFIGDKKKVKGSIKLLRKYDMVDAIEIVKDILKSSNKQQKSMVKVKAKLVCSNPYCIKVEKDQRFQMCSKCKKEFYCSKSCQKRHWKNAHKANCFE